MQPAPWPVLDAGRSARVMSALAGGIHHRAADRDLARRIADRFPGYADRFHGAMDAGTAVAREAAREGLRGLLITAAQFPDGTWPVTHTGFLDASPANRAVCASADAEILAVCRAMSPRTGLVEGVTPDAEGLLGSAAVRAMTHPAGDAGPRLPVAVIIRPVACWWDGGTAARVTADYARLLPPGSLLAMFVPAPGNGPGRAEWLALMEQAAGTPAHAHDPDSARGWFAGAGLDGVTVRDTRSWDRQGWFSGELTARRPYVFGVTGRVPGP